MKRTRKRVLSLLIAFTMMFSIVSVTAMDSDEDGANAETTQTEIMETEGSVEDGSSDENKPAVAQWKRQEYPSLESAIEAAMETGDDEIITLLEDAEAQFPQCFTGNLEIDLDSHTLTLTNGYTVHVGASEVKEEGGKSVPVIEQAGADLTISNGSLKALQIGDGTTSVFTIYTGSEITLDNVEFDTTGTALFPCGDAASVQVSDSTIYCGTYAVGTNAATTDNYNVKITLIDSVFESKYGYKNNDNDSCPILVNVPCKLNMLDCTVKGTRQGVVVRGGDAVIDGCTIELTGAYTSGADKYWNSNWGSGNEVPMAALLVGNRSSAYRYPATCEVTDTEITAADGYKAVYVYGNSESYAATLSIDNSKSEKVVTGAIAAGTEDGNSVISVLGGMFSEEVDDTFLPLGYVCVSSQGSELYQVSIQMGLEADVEAADSTANAAISGTYWPELSGDEDNGEKVEIDQSKVTFNVASNGENVTEANVAINPITADSLNSVDVVIQTDVADVELDKAAMGKVSRAASNDSTIELVIKDITPENEKNNIVAAYEVTLKVDGENVLPEEEASQNGTITISIPWTNESVTEPLVYYVQNNVPVKNMNAVLDKDDKGKAVITFTTNHLSEYAIYSAAQETAVAKCGVNYYATLEAAVENAQDGDTIQILDDVAVSAAINPRKTLTFEGVTKADGKKPIISGSNGLFSQAGEGRFTLENLNLETAADDKWYIYHSANKLTIDNCDFTMAEGVSHTGNIIMGEGQLPTDTSEYALEFTNNTITANSRAAITGIGNNSVIEDNVIDLISEKHGETNSRTSILSLVAKEGGGSVKITGNTFKNANRALAVDNSTLAASDLTYQENKFINVRFALEISPEKNKDNGTYDINNNYYSFDDVVSEPKIENADSNGSHFEFADVNASSTEYKPASGETDLVKNDVYYLDESMDPDDLNSHTEIEITANPTSMKGKGTITLTVKRIKLPENAKIAVICDIEDVTIVEKGEDTYTVSLPNSTETYTFTARYVGDDVYDAAEDSCTVTVTKKSTSGDSSSSGDYKITVDSVKNGKVTVSPAKADKGDTVTITVKPNSGYVLDELVITDKNGKEISYKEKSETKFTFTMPGSKVTVEATFAPEKEEDKTIVLTIGSTLATVYGQPVINDVAPLARNNRTMLPIRFVAEALGARVDWDQAQQKVTITRDTLVIEIYLGSDVAYVNGAPVQLDSPAFAENNRTYLPLRFVAENLGAQVDWDQATQTVTITVD